MLNVLRSRSTGRASAGERCSDCGKPFAEGERITKYWLWGKVHSKMCRNSVACEKRMPEKELRAMSEEKVRIEVQYSTDGLFGSTDPDDYDEKASITQFGTVLTNHLHNAYHDAEITVSYGIGDSVKVNGLEDHEETPWIEQIIEKVWGDWGDWLVGK